MCLQVGDALFAGDVVFVGGTISLLNVPGCELANYRACMGRLAGLGSSIRPSGAPAEPCAVRSALAW